MPMPVSVTEMLTRLPSALHPVLRVIVPLRVNLAANRERMEQIRPCLQVKAWETPGPLTLKVWFRVLPCARSFLALAT